MQIRPAAFIFTFLCIPISVCALQSPASGAGGPSPAATNAQAPATTPSAILKSSLDGLQQTVGGLQMDKWKKSAVRDEASSNVNSIQKDLQSTLPGLLKDADGSPRTTSKLLPVARNIDALYDVVLRVVDGARVVAPGDQFGQLQQAMTALEKGRHALNDHIQDVAAAQEKQIGDLQVALKSQPAPVCPVAPPPVVASPAPAKKPAAKKRKPAAAKPTTTPPAGTATPAPANPPTAKPQ